MYLYIVIIVESKKKEDTFLATFIYVTNLATSKASLLHYLTSVIHYFANFICHLTSSLATYVITTFYCISLLLKYLCYSCLPCYILLLFRSPSVASTNFDDYFLPPARRPYVQAPEIFSSFSSKTVDEGAAGTDRTTIYSTGPYA